MITDQQFRQLDQKIDRLLAFVKLMVAEEIQMDIDIQNLIDQAKQNTDIEDSALIAINGLAEKLAAAIASSTTLSAADRALLQKEVSEMKAAAAPLAAAVAANITPAGPVISSIVPTSGPTGSTVVVNGPGFGAAQGTSTVTVNGAIVTPVSWSDAEITIGVSGPSGTASSIVVTVGGLASAPASFSIS